VSAVLPLTNKSRSEGPGYQVENRGSRIILRGGFAAIVDAMAITNLAPSGAREVVLNAATGAVVGIR
jgi:hypothetical protein